LCIAYLVSLYPAPSHTFIRREVSELRRNGLNIKTFSIRQPLQQEILSKDDEQEFNSTWYLLPVSPILLLKTHLLSLIKSPLRYISTLKLAFLHRVPGLSLYPLFYFAEAIYLSEQLKKAKIIHLHNHFAQAGAIVGMLSAHYLNISWSFTVHGTSEFDGAAGVLLNDKMKAAKFVACVSYFGRAQVMRICNPIYWSKLFISRCGVDITSMPVKQAKIEQKNKKIRLICVARLSPEKGIIGLLNSFFNALQQNNKLQLTIIGEGPEHFIIEQEISKLGIKENCKLLGRASEKQVFDELLLNDIFILSSFMEGLPVVIMEALAIGIPVIAPAVAGIPELIKHNCSGLLFSPSNWDELSQHILNLSNNKELRIKLAIEGNKRVKQEFDIRQAVKPLLKNLDSNSRYC